jgi:murein DD-endopeptidase MepM/ murein hydrolase activator NlpD
MKWSRILFIIISLIMVSCKQVQKISDIFVQPSPREVYSRNFESDDVKFIQWQSAFEVALQDSLLIELPYAEIGNFGSSKLPVYSLNILLKQGEKLMVSVNSNSSPSLVFIDIKGLINLDSLQPSALLSEISTTNLPIELPILETGTYKVLVQPELKNAADFVIEIYSVPTFAFPVAGVTDKSIQSFWGAPRSNGNRLHEGLDIFAAKSTPVLAVTEGFISYTGERGLGGKQVWLRNGIFGKSFYYAHLDSIKVSSATRVKTGDTLGFIGNTGNARFTAPHLHFGIYEKEGAIDPLPFIKRNKRQKQNLIQPFKKGIIRGSKANLRLGPNTESLKIFTFSDRDTLHILGKTSNWFHVKLQNGLQGFVFHSLISEVINDKASDLKAK